VLGFLLPELDLSCLRLGDSKLNEKLMKLDEQSVRIFSIELFVFLYLFIVVGLRLTKHTKSEFFYAKLDNQQKKKCIIIVS
jgi:hypothetical protein